MACCFLNTSEDCLRLGREAHGANVCTSHFRALHHCVILHFLHTCTNPQHSQVFICHMLRIWMQKSLRRKELLWFCDFCCRYSTSEHKRVNVLVPWTAFYGHFGFSEGRGGAAFPEDLARRGRKEELQRGWRPLYLLLPRSLGLPRRKARASPAVCQRKTLYFGHSSLSHFV